MMRSHLGPISALIFSATLLPFASQAAEISLSPNQNKGSGQLPSGYSRLVFATGDGDWTDRITLPAKPAHNDVVSLRTDASYASSLDALGTDFPIRSLRLLQGDRFDFTFNASTRTWAIANIRQLDPASGGPGITTESARLTRYAMSDGNWVPEVFMPAVARDGDLIAIHTDATWPSRINPGNLLFASSFNVTAGDTYVFNFRGDLKKWIPDAVPVRRLPVAAAIARPSTPRSFLQLLDGQWVGEMTLPSAAGDRDRLTIGSDSGKDSLIRNQNVNFGGAMRLKRGQKYEFLYVKENALWELTASPDTVMQAQNLPDGLVPRLGTPRSIVRVAGPWTGSVNLPANPPRDSRVIVESSAAKPFKVTARGMAVAVHPGETVAFKANAGKQWQQETRTIDLLLLYSEKAASRFGESGARARMFESFSMTNQALENSGANFRYRIVGLRKFASPPDWATLADPLTKLREHPVAQQWRNELRADGIYYEGTEEGCGLAFVRSESFNMVATGSTACGTTVMRHEMGHNMGLDHAGEGGSSYAQGYSPVRSIMGGNEIPFYATPLRFTSDLGMRMGVADRIDAVRAMNEFSSQVASYR